MEIFWREGVKLPCFKKRVSVTVIFLNAPRLETVEYLTTKVCINYLNGRMQDGNNLSKMRPNSVGREEFWYLMRLRDTINNKELWEKIRSKG